MYIHIVYVCTCKRNYTYRNTHTRGRQVTVAPACRTDNRRVLLDNAPNRRMDRRMDRRAYTGYCPVPGRSRDCAISFVSTRFLSKDVSYTISITCPSYFFLLPSRFVFIPVLFFNVLFAKRRILFVHHVRKWPKKKKHTNHYTGWRKKVGNIRLEISRKI